MKGPCRPAHKGVQGGPGVPGEVRGDPTRVSLQGGGGGVRTPLGRWTGGLVSQCPEILCAGLGYGPLLAILMVFQKSKEVRATCVINILLCPLSWIKTDPIQKSRGVRPTFC